MSERRQQQLRSAKVRRLADLEAAIADDEIEILFQPQVRIADDAIVGVEALARWQHPDLGELGPRRLFEIAERSGVVPALSTHIQTRALALAARWSEPTANLRLSVNVTSEDVSEPGFAGAIVHRARTADFALDRLTLEITETGLMADLSAASGILQGLRDQGVRIAIDDFGTGYSSLAYLKALPFDYLKIDQSLTRDIGGTPRDGVIVRAVIAMARGLGMGVIAEGVESESERALLRAEGCGYYQGFLCSPAVSSAALEALLGQNQ